MAASRNGKLKRAPCPTPRNCDGPVCISRAEGEPCLSGDPATKQKYHQRFRGELRSSDLATIDQKAVIPERETPSAERGIAAARALNRVSGGLIPNPVWER